MDIVTPRLYLAVSLARCQESHELVNLLKGDAHTIISSNRENDEEFYIFDQISRYIEVKCTPCISNSLLTAVLTVAV
jgi:hypothetical protein